MFIVDNLIMIKGNGFTVFINELDEVSFLIINPSLSFSTSPWGATSTDSTSTASSTDSSSSTDSLPRVIEFENLDQPENLKAAKVALKGLTGVYAFVNNLTGAVYIGSSINLAQRLVDHAVYKDTNVRLVAKMP